jgi:hypothetical protein
VRGHFLTLTHIRENRMPVFQPRTCAARSTLHVPESWMPVFRTGLPQRRRATCAIAKKKYWGTCRSIQSACAVFLALVLFPPASRAAAGCVDPSAWAGSTASITHMFDASEQQSAEPGVAGIRGTAWFLSSTSIVTVGHVAEAMNLSSEAWRQIDILQGDSRRSMRARMRGLAGAGADKIAVLELQSPVPDAHGLRLRMEPLIADEPVASLAYPGGRQRVASGRFVRYGDEERYSGDTLLELYDGNDRLVLDHGASGAPVLDCEGRVVAVVDELFERTIELMSKPIRISTAWGTPNVVAIPVTALKDFHNSD